MLSTVNQRSPFSVNQIGPYRLTRTLGEGTFGKVKLGIDERSMTKVAVKIMKKDSRRIKTITNTGRKEIQMLTRFKGHPNIVQLIEHKEYEDAMCTVMEYCEGGEYFDLIAKKGRLSEEDSREYFGQLLSGLEFIHSKNTSHRDLKPENLLLDHKERLKIADFGLSKQFEDGKFLKTSCGSPNYAAPELLTGELYDGPAVDMWSAGIILYASLIGQLPFDSDSVPELFEQIKSCHFKSPFLFDKLSPEVSDLIVKLLQPNPVKRLKAKEALKHQWLVKKEKDQTRIKQFGVPIFSQLQKSRLQIIQKRFKLHQSRKSSEIELEKTENISSQEISKNLYTNSQTTLTTQASEMMATLFKNKESSFLEEDKKGLDLFDSGILKSQVVTKMDTELSGPEFNSLNSQNLLFSLTDLQFDDKKFLTRTNGIPNNFYFRIQCASLPAALRQISSFLDSEHIDHTIRKSTATSNPSEISFELSFPSQSTVSLIIYKEHNPPQSEEPNDDGTDTCYNLVTRVETIKQTMVALDNVIKLGTRAQSVLFQQQ